MNLYAQTEKMPFPVASIVEFQDNFSKDITRYLIEEISFADFSYSLIGHKKLKSHRMGYAWAEKSRLTLIELPSEESWEMLQEAKESEYD